MSYSGPWISSLSSGTGDSNTNFPLATEIICASVNKGLYLYFHNITSCSTEICVGLHSHLVAFDPIDARSALEKRELVVNLVPLKITSAHHNYI